LRSELKFEVVVKSKGSGHYVKVDSFSGRSKELLEWLNTKYIANKGFWDVIGDDFDYVAMKIDEWIKDRKK